MEDDETCRDIFGIFKLNKNRIDRSSLCHLGPTPPGSWRRSGAAWTHRWKWNAWEILRTGNRFMTILWHFMNWVHQLIVNLVDVCWYSRVFFFEGFPTVTSTTISAELRSSWSSRRRTGTCPRPPWDRVNRVKRVNRLVNVAAVLFSKCQEVALGIQD